jgi:hypothetical protein
MDPHLLTATILLASSLVVLAIGYLIGCRKQLSLIAGLGVSKVRDGDGLARWVGTGLLCIGALDLLLSLALFAAPVGEPLVIAAYVAVSLGGAVVLLSRVRRYLS